MRLKFQLAEDPIWIHPMGTEAFTKELANLGIRVVNDRPDLTLAVASTIERMPDEPTLIFEQLDTSKPTRMATRWESPHVLGYIVPALTFFQSHADILYRIDGTTKPVYALTTMLWHQLEYFILHGLDTSKPKDLDVVFTGSISHVHGYIRARRRDMVDNWFNATGLRKAVGVFHGANPMEVPRPLDGYQNLELLSRAKVVLCPPGNLELCWRDYEAVLCGCVIVKPEQAHMELTSNPWRHVVWCKPDYSDLMEAIEQAIDHYDTNQNLINQAAVDMATSGRDLSILARAVHKIVTDAMNKKADGSGTEETDLSLRIAPESVE